MIEAEHGGIPDDLHFDVTKDAVVLESLLRVLKLALSPAARDGMAGQTDDGLRWRVNREGEPIRVAFLAGGLSVIYEKRGLPSWRRWEGMSVDIPWSTAEQAVFQERSGSEGWIGTLELLANVLEVKRFRNPW